MLIGELLIAQGSASREQVQAALAHQEEHGGPLGDILVKMQVIDDRTLQECLAKIPGSLSKAEDTGLSRDVLMELIAKALHVTNIEDERGLADYLKLPPAIIRDLTEDAEKRLYVERRGNPNDRFGLNFVVSLTARGKEWAKDALERNLYVGPAPVPFERFCAQVEAQSIRQERLTAQDIAEAFQGYVYPSWFIRIIGPAANSGRAILFYGPPGNGKSTMAERLAKTFRGIVFIPYALESDGQIIRLYDHLLHKPLVQGGLEQEKTLLLKEHHDPRWVVCQRPVVVAGAELTLEMLDLQYDPISKIYEAPLHIKALNGTLIVDDFGRQLVSPVQLLNRWIVPMESRIDYLKFQSGVSLRFPIDQLLVFTTNLQPKDLMDPAFLRRIHYKVELQGPSDEEFRALLTATAGRYGLALSEDDKSHIRARITDYYGEHLSYFHPEFIFRQISEACAFQGVPLQFTQQLANDAMANLFIRPTS